MSDHMNAAQAESEGRNGDRTLVVERVFRATPEKVFAAWTDPIQLAKWWGPEGMFAPDVEMDARTGGAWRTVMANDDGMRVTVSGRYREVSPPDRLVMTWGWQQEDGTRGHETEIVLTLEDVPEGTRLRLVQSVFETADDRNRHGMGWNSSFNDLERVFV